MLVFVPVLGGALVWQVRQGPISVAQLLPTLSDLVRDRTGAELVAKDASLAWDDERSRVIIRLTQVEISTGEGAAITRLPLVDASYRLRGLLRGVWLPTAIAVHRPRLVLARGATGDLRIGVDEADVPTVAPDPGGAGFDLRAALAPLMAPGDEHLDSIAVVDAEATVIDVPQGRQYSIPRLTARVERTPTGLAAQADLSAKLGGVTAFFALGATYAEAVGEIHATLDFQEVVPSLFAVEFQALAPAKGVAVPLSGRITARLKPADIAHIGVDDLLRADAQAEILGGAGVVVAPDPIALAYPIKAFRIRGDYDGRAGRGTLDTLLVELPDATVAIEASASWPVADDSRPPASGVRVVATARLTDTAIDSFDRYWPPGVVKDARDWVVENLRDGQVEEARFSAELTGPDWAGIDVTQFEGEARVKGASVHYLRPMPPITDVDGTVLFGLKAVEVLPDTGHVGNLVIQPGGRVVLSGLADETQWADISADIVGPAREALKLVDHEPLKLLSAMGTVDPDKVSGNGKTHLTLKFPLLLDLRLADMTVNANSHITEAAVKDAIPGRSLADGVLDLAVDLDHLDIKGAGKVNGVPMKLGWEEKFSGPGNRTRYTISGTIDDAGRKALGLDFMPFQDPYITGPMVADAVALVDAKGRMALDAKLDLTAATITAPGMGWRKEPGAAASGSATIHFLKGRLLDISQFQIRSDNGLDVAGSAKAATDGTLRTVDLSRLDIADNRVKGGLTIAGDGSVDMSLEAERVNLQPLVHDGGWHELTGDDDAAGTPPEPSTPMILNLSAKRAQLSEAGQMTGLSATLARGTDGKWVGTINGNLPQGKTVIVVQRQGASRSVEIASADAGALLTASGVTDSIRSGTMKMTATIPDDGPVTGKLRIDNYNVVNAPILARLVSVASITGIADLLTNTGVSFWYLDAPFSMDDGVLTLHETRAAGPSFGLTTNGTVNTDSDALALKGTIVPFNLVNQVIAGIPVLGQILGGKESGLFAMSYGIKGTLDKPDVSVNPLSALVPGGVKKLFFPDDKIPMPETAPPQPAAPAQP